MRSARQQVLPPPGRSRDRADDADSRCGRGSSRSRTRSAEFGAPISTGAAGAALDQGDAAQDQRAHDALAELGLGDQQRGAGSSGGIDQRLDLAFGVAVDQRGRAGQLADLGQELARALLDDRRDMAEAVALGDREHGL